MDFVLDPRFIAVLLGSNVGVLMVVGVVAAVQITRWGWRVTVFTLLAISAITTSAAALSGTSGEARTTITDGRHTVNGLTIEPPRADGSDAYYYLLIKEEKRKISYKFPQGMVSLVCISNDEMPRLEVESKWDLRTAKLFHPFGCMKN